MVKSILIFLSFVTAIGFIFGLFFLQRAMDYVGRIRITCLLIWIIGIGGTLLFAIIRIGGGEYDPVIGESGGGGFVAVATIWFKRIITIFSLLISIGIIIHSLANRNERKIGISLICSYLVFVAFSFILGSFFGTVPAFTPQLFYGPIMLISLFMINDIPLEKFIAHVKSVILLIVIGSVLLCLKIDWAFFHNSLGTLIPGLPGRLAGLTAHPNVLGPLAVIYLLLEWYHPARSRFFHLSFSTFAVIALVLSQSKTALIAAILASVILLLYHIQSSKLLDEGSHKIRSQLTFVLSVGSIFLPTLFFGFLFLDRLDLRSYFFHHSILASLFTFMGRTEIWEITLQLWERSPWFGYGPTLWGQTFRTQFSLLYVGQAHNQVIQTLGDSGVIGLSGLLIYLITLIVYSVKAMSHTKGLSLALVVFLLFRCGTETPIRTLAVIDATFFMHFIVFGFLLFSTREAVLKSDVLKK